MSFPADHIESMVKQFSMLKPPTIIRKDHLAQKVVFVDGQHGCGKTMLSPIVASFDRVELLTYAYEIEYTCSLLYLKKMEPDAAWAMVRMLTDLQIYNTMMGRETNFRPSDLSSVFFDVDPWRYFKRIFQKGDEATIPRLQKERPILHLTTHNLLGISEPVFQALGDRAVLIEVVRHPLYMIKQQILNMERILDNVRDFSIYFKHKGHQVPFWIWGWEDLFIKSNNAEKVIYSIQFLSQLTEKIKKTLKAQNSLVVTVPFECFVINPWGYMEQIKTALGSTIIPRTLRMLKKQNVPRKIYADGIGLKIYKRCGWVPPQPGSDENKEFELRWNMACETISPEAKAVLKKICEDYEEKYLGGKKEYRKV